MDIKITYSAQGPEKTTGISNEDLTVTAVKDGNRTVIRIRPEKGITLKDAKVSFEYDFDRKDQFYVNGYQSWTDTREFDYNEELHNMNGLPRRLKGRYHFPAYGDSWFREYKRGDIHGFTYAYVKHSDGNAELIGSYNEENAYLVIIYHKKITG